MQGVRSIDRHGYLHNFDAMFAGLTSSQASQLPQRVYVAHRICAWHGSLRELACLRFCFYPARIKLFK